MTPDIERLSDDEFTDYVEQQTDDYTDKPLKGTNRTVSGLLSYLDQVDHDVYVHVRMDGRRAGTVLGLDTVVETAAEVKTLVDQFNASVIERMADRDEDDAVKVELMFD